MLASMTLTNGVAVYTTSTLASGAHTITASYGGDGIYAQSNSPVLNQTISNGSTTTTLTAAKNPVVYGQDTVVLTVTGTSPATNKPAPVL